MLLVKTRIGPSKTHGIGLFADQFIPKNMPIWKFTPGFDIKVTEHEVKKLPKLAQKYFSHFAFLNPETNKYVLCIDDARFYNHSENPNTVSIDHLGEEEGVDMASRDIKIGEELTIDYREFDVLSKNDKNLKN